MIIFEILYIIWWPKYDSDLADVGKSGVLKNDQLSFKCSKMCDV